jgi:hypothetical protein
VAPIAARPRGGYTAVDVMMTSTQVLPRKAHLVVKLNQHGSELAAGPAPRGAHVYRNHLPRKRRRWDCGGHQAPFIIHARIYSYHPHRCASFDSTPSPLEAALPQAFASTKSNATGHTRHVCAVWTVTDQRTLKDARDRWRQRCRAEKRRRLGEVRFLPARLATVLVKRATHTDL